MKKYRVINEYWDMWGVSNEEESIVDHAEIERLADEWEMTVKKLMEQVEEI